MMSRNCVGIVVKWVYDP